MIKITLLTLLLSSAVYTQVETTPIVLDPDSYKLPNLLPALDYEDDEKFRTDATKYIPVKDDPFYEHVKQDITNKEILLIDDEIYNKRNSELRKTLSKQLGKSVTSIVSFGNNTYVGTLQGLYIIGIENKPIMHTSYGVNGPLSTVINGIALDSKGTIWFATPIGLSKLCRDGAWQAVRGSNGLPVENVSALAIDKDDKIWLGTSEGAILYTPYEQDRQWYYRAGKRYLINDVISDIVISEDSKNVYFQTVDGSCKLSMVEKTLLEKAEIIEERLNKWHRREGLVAECRFDDAENPTSHIIHDNDNDGLWTSYHVVAMSLAYASTGERKYLESAKESMHAMIMLQNASGTPGLVARSVLPISEREKKSEQWRVTPDGKMIWKSDTSSDEIDGHYFAFYAYWEHIAKHDKDEDQLIKNQITDLTDYIVDNNYQLIDWTGERTRWGFWNPELLNDDPEHYLENGLNSAQILSFLRTAYHITGNEKYIKHYNYLIIEHGYLANILMEKKAYPDENNHSDNQLGYCALYPLLQLEHGEKERNALQRAVRRHQKILNRDGSAFFYFAAATIDPDFVEIKDAVTNLRQIPTDRRQWRMINSKRDDIVWHPRLTRFGKKQLLTVLPGDEVSWSKWNSNPYLPDTGSDGRNEDDGASWLLGYWMGRFHGFISEK